jgi:hypothetical protein
MKNDMDVYSIIIFYIAGIKEPNSMHHRYSLELIIWIH